MKKPEFPPARLIREDFLPEPMKNYRIKKVNHSVLGTIYYVQQRVFFFFWDNIYPSSSPFIGFYETYEDALQDIKDRVKTKKDTEYIYNID
jgi:hypothetical protein